jgi:hypothetical protein
MRCPFLPPTFCSRVCPSLPFVRASKLISIHQGLIRKRLGSVSQPTSERVLLQLQGIFRA